MNASERTRFMNESHPAYKAPNSPKTVVAGGAGGSGVESERNRGTAAEEGATKQNSPVWVSSVLTAPNIKPENIVGLHKRGEASLKHRPG